MTQTNTLPTGSDIPSTQTDTWRIADGKIKRGSEKLGTEEHMPGNKVLGDVVRFGIQSGTGKEDGKPWKQLEVDLLTGNGKVRVKVNYNFQQDCWPTQGIGLAKYLASLNPTDCIVIEPSKSKEPNAHGSFTTFVNVDRWNKELARRELIDTEWEKMKFRDIVDDVFEALEEHALYKERVADSEESERDFVEQLLAQRNWVPLSEGDAWIKWVNKTANKEFSSLEDLDDDWFNWMRCQLDDLDECPVKVGAAKPKKPAPPSKPAVAETFDPFADD